MTTIPTSTDINGELTKVYAVIGVVAEPYRAALIEAVSQASPVVRADGAVEALYAAMIKDEALSDNDRQLVATVCKQVGYLMTVYSWHGKAQRCADMGVACEAVYDGTHPADLTERPEVDEKFAPPAAVMAAPDLPLAA